MARIPPAEEIRRQVPLRVHHLIRQMPPAGEAAAVRIPAAVAVVEQVGAVVHIHLVTVALGPVGKGHLQQDGEHGLQLLPVLLRVILIARDQVRIDAVSACHFRDAVAAKLTEAQVGHPREAVVVVLHRLFHVHGDAAPILVDEPRAGAAEVPAGLQIRPRFADALPLRGIHVIHLAQALFYGL